VLDRPKAFTLALGISLAAIVVSLVFASRVSRKMPDLEVYWTAASRARAGEALYRAQDGHYQFKYLPAFAIFTIPLSIVSLPVAKAIWFSVSIGLIAALLFLSRAVMPEVLRPTWALVSLTLMTMAKFYAHELVLGQMNILFAVVVLCAVVAMRHGREAAAGLLVAAAVAVKPYAILLLPWLIARRRVESTAAAATGVIAVFLLPAAIYGVTGNIALHREWWTTVTASTAPNLTNADNVSVAAMWAKWIGAGVLATTLTAVIAAALLSAAVLVFVRRKAVTFPEALEAALILTLVPLLSPQGWDYVCLVSTPAIMLLVNYAGRLGAVVRTATVVALAIIALSLYDVMGRQAYARFMALSVITLCYVVVIAALWTMRQRQVA
jgi:Glycosyltransferase family 87